MTMTSQDCWRKDAKKKAKQKSDQFAFHDYHNPQGQFRNYEPSLKSLPKQLQHVEHDFEEEVDDTKVGVKRLTNELKRRAEKTATSIILKADFEGVDVSYVNQRN